ncbi:sulfate transporter family-domain-containing protein [Obelidium mucronatum]|nr:sulfate transporter family-domain-containing protein [Obelidium mucronatum]
MHPQRPPPPDVELAKSIRASIETLPFRMRGFIVRLCPMASWIHRYNVNWFIHDAIAGFTIGLVVIPQSIAYSSKLAHLPPQYGLYTAFISVVVYSLFSTSKDATTGPTSIISLLIAQNVAANLELFPTVQDQVVLASTLAFWSGIVQVLMGMFRLGIIVDFIPSPVIAGFSAGAGVQSAVAQLPSLLGIKGVKTTDAPYLVLVNFFKAIGNSTKVDLLFGCTSLCVLMLMKKVGQSGKKNGAVMKYIGILRNAIVILLCTIISYLCRDLISITLVGDVPFGLSDLVQPKLDSTEYTQCVLKLLPGILIASLLEHIAVAKSYGRLNGYVADENQEIFALGMSNLVGSFVGAYTCSASFSRSAIQSSSGVKTPMATMFTGIAVIIALYTITPALHYIPTAVLAAIIIPAASELCSSVKTASFIYRISLVDFIGYWLAFLVSCFVSIQVAIFTSVGFSVAVLLLRIARPQFTVLSSNKSNPKGNWVDMEGLELGERDRGGQDLQVPEGILVFRPEESVTFPNSSYILGCVKKCMTAFRAPAISLPKSDRVWSEEVDSKECVVDQDKPLLRAVVIDFSAVNHIDYSGMQTLLDAKQDIEKFAGRMVPFHFANVRPRHLNTVWCIPNGTRASEIDMTPGIIDGLVEESQEESSGSSSGSSRSSGSYSSSSISKYENERIPTLMRRPSRTTYWKAVGKDWIETMLWKLSDEARKRERRKEMFKSAGNGRYFHSSLQRAIDAAQRQADNLIDLETLGDIPFAIDDGIDKLSEYNDDADDENFMISIRPKDLMENK